MYLSWRSIPLLRAATALAVGIVLANAYPDIAWGYVAVVGAITLIGFVAPIGLSWRATARGGATLLLVALAGYVHMRVHLDDRSAAALPPHDFFIAELLEVPRGQGDWLGADARVTNVRQEGRDSAVDVRVRLMFERADVAAAERGGDSAVPRLLLPGATLVSSARLDSVSPPRNPHAFDYASLLARRGITRQAWLRSPEYRVVAAAPTPAALARVRSWIASRIDAGIGGSREAGVAKALLLGDKSGIDESTRLTYTATGAVHVLAVSGLHTGVIAFVLVWLLQRGLRRRHLPLQFALLLAGLFAYVALTGYSPSVIRASVMFAIIFAGRLWRQRAQGLNNLGAAALVTLVYDPGLLLTLGFQLSYLAVAGIMLFYRPLRRHLLLPYWELPRLSDLLAVSIAATVGTAPLTIYYFHQFPIYFALSGLVAVPLVSLALPTLLATVALDGLALAVGLEAPWLYGPATALLWACNAFLEQLARLPHVLLEGLWPPPLVVALALVTVGLSGVLVTNRRRPVYYATIVTLVLATAAQVTNSLGRRTTSETIVYSLRDGHIVDVRMAGYTYVASDGTATERSLDRDVRPHRRALGFAEGASAEAEAVYEDSAFAFYVVGDTRWAEIRDPARALPPASWSLDWVSVAEPDGVDPASLAQAFPGAQILLGRRPPPWERAAWEPYRDRVHLLGDAAYVHAPLTSRE